MSNNLYTDKHAQTFSLEQLLAAERLSLLHQVKRLSCLGFTGNQIKRRLLYEGTSHHLAATAERLVNLWQS